MPVLFRDGVAVVSDAIPTAIASWDVPRTLSEAWCKQQGLKDEAGSAVVLRSLSGSNVAFISLGQDPPSFESFRVAGADALRAA